MGFTTLSLTGRALRLLSQREHSRAELQRKLGPHVQEGEDLNAVLDGLQAKGFISEERVAASVLRQRAARLAQRKGLGREPAFQVGEQRRQVALRTQAAQRTRGRAEHAHHLAAEGAGAVLHIYRKRPMTTIIW
mgnify:CR=1 FL=1